MVEEKAKKIAALLNCDIESVLVNMLANHTVEAMQLVADLNVNIPTRDKIAMIIDDAIDELHALKKRLIDIVAQDIHEIRQI